MARPRGEDDLRERQLRRYREQCMESCCSTNSAVIAALSVANARGVYDFSRTYLGDLQFLPIAASLSLDPHLRALLVPQSGLRDKGLVELCQHLRSCPSLETLDISGNRFSLQGAQACRDLHREHPRLASIKAADTCLDAEFCINRGLGPQYKALQLEMERVLERPALVPSLQPKPPTEARPGLQRPGRLFAAPATEAIEPQLAHSQPVVAS
mmetsp:Transcript_21750/g.39973  ORF Transcript_21750/g.39973 Transcript_21750/m.39973 type:complete len:212 (+) Transcript_21750:67-702(+)